MSTDPQPQPVEPRTGAPLARRAPGELAGPITPEERERLLEVCARSGPIVARKVLARGRVDSSGRPSRRRTLLDLLETDLDFRAEWQRACEEFESTLEERIVRESERADTTTRFDPKTGAVVEVREERRNQVNLMLRLAEAINPARWAPKRNITAETKNLNVNIDAGRDGYLLRADDVLFLDEPDRLHFLDCLRVIRERRAAERGGSPDAR